MSLGLGLGPASGGGKIGEARLDALIAVSGVPSTPEDIHTFKEWLLANHLLSLSTPFTLTGDLGSLSWGTGVSNTLAIAGNFGPATAGAYSGLPGPVPSVSGSNLTFTGALL